MIGAGGVASVAAYKCCQNHEVFSELMIASRTLSRCEALKARLESRFGSDDRNRDDCNRDDRGGGGSGGRTRISVARVDADDKEQLIALMRSFKPDIVINVALPYQDLTIMEACLETGADYVDTANYEPPDTAKFEYGWQWAYSERFKEAGLTALLGSGFDPGVTGVFCAYAQKHHFDTIKNIDILDANAGDHGYPFATNFNPEINIREVTANGRFFEDGQFIETAPLSVKRVYDFPEIGKKDIYLLYHEELESLAINIRGVCRIRFWMTFSENYLTHLRVLENVWMTSIKPILYEGREIIPLQFLKAVLPDPASLGPRTKGKTNIGCVIQGVKDGKPRDYYIYNVSDHEDCFRETGAQAISYTTGVPAMIGASMLLSGVWKGPGVFNIEQFDPDPFMDALNRFGLPWNDNFAPEPLDG